MRTSGSELGKDGTKKVPVERFKCPLPALIKMDAAVKVMVEETREGTR
jgi:hypothetical protein